MPLVLWMLMCLAHNVDAAILSAHGQVVIELDENPSTGHQWYLQSWDPAVLKPKSTQFLRADTGLLGAPGKKQFVFETVSHSMPLYTTVKLVLLSPTHEPMTVSEQKVVIDG